MNDFREFQASAEDRVRRSQFSVRIGNLADERLDSSINDSTPEQRLAMVCRSRFKPGPSKGWTLLNPDFRDILCVLHAESVE